MKLLTHIRKYIIPLLAVVALSVLILRSKSSGIIESADKLEKSLKESETVFRKKASESNELLSDLRARKKDSRSVSELREAHINVFYFRNDSLLFWTDNISTLPLAALQIEDTVGVLHLKNGWYQFLKKRIDGSQEIIAALRLIKNDYPFENRFLKNDFDPSFQLPLNVRLTDQQVDASVAIKSNSGSSLFYIYSAESGSSHQMNYPVLFAEIVLLLLLLYYTYKIAVRYPINQPDWVSSVLLLVSVVIIRGFMLTRFLPLELNQLPLFNPEYYASSWITPSLGDLLLNATLYACWIYFITSRLKHKTFKPTYAYIWLAVASVFISTAILTWVFKTLVMDSVISFEVYNILTLDFYSLLGMFGIAALVAAHYFIADVAIRILRDTTHKKWTFVTSLLTCLAIYLTGTYHNQFWQSVLFSGFWTLIFIAVFLFIKKRNIATGSFIVIILSAYALLNTFLIENLYERKERNQRSFFAGKLVSDRDYVAEFLFNDVQQTICEDPFIKTYFKGTLVNRKDISDRISSLYLGGYFNRYDLKLLTFDAEGNSFRNEDSLNLGMYFKALTVESFHSHSLFYSSDTAKNYSYTSLITVRNDSTPIGYLLLQLLPKTYYGQNVYPELLVGSDLQTNKTLYAYDYAIYQNDKLVSQSGEFPYSYYWNKEFKFGNLDEAFVEEPEWEHTIRKFPTGKKIVVSISREPVFEPIATFSYLLAFYLSVLGAAMILVFLINRSLTWNDIQRSLSLSFKSRINYSMLLMIVLSFLIIGGITIQFFSKQYEKFYSDRLQRKEKVIHATLEYFIRQNYQQQSGLFGNTILNALKYEVARLSEINSIDINLFSTDGKLAITSQPAIYERGLLARRMNAEAYFELERTKGVQMTGHEKIGNLSYLATYSPILDQSGNPVAYLGIPYFERSRDINNEVSSFLVSLMNVYVFLLICATLLAFFVSNSITKPLTIIGEKLRLLNLNRKNEIIEWNSNDEIGTLINEYNKMISELEQSAQKLAKSERETAWREMAKQIAHEIKNPLTPMRLSIQYLQRAVDEGKPNIEELVKKVTKTLDEQIENLSSIATAFSSFAKMPKAENEIIQLTDLLRSIADLFNRERNAQVTFETELTSASIFADKNQMISVFNNLVKNAIQSIPENRLGFVIINAVEDEGWVVVSVKDNGVGISTEDAEKVFVPNFTTKSSGTGLGLAITKQIIDGTGGKIWFESNAETGTTFFVRLKLLRPDK